MLGSKGHYLQLSTTSRIPVELWRLVFSYISDTGTTARQCLFVSRLFHDLAAPLLFATVRLHFGPWQVAYGLGHISSPEDHARAHESSRMLLCTMIKDPVFASHVKHLYVLAFATRYEDHKSMLGHLIEALRSLKNLRTLRWYTESSLYYAAPDVSLLETMVAYCPRLRECALPFECADVIAHWKQMPFRSLTLQGPYRFLFPTSKDDLLLNPERHKYLLSTLMDMHAGSPLTRLEIPGYTAWSIPQATLQHLAHLGIREASNLDKVTVLLENCVRLESLWISSEGDPSQTSVLLTALAANPEAFRHLTHLKLALAAPPDDDGGIAAINELQKLTPFLLSKKKLRCFDWSEPWGSIEFMRPLLGSLSSLPQLKVLGLDLTCDDDDATEMLKSGMLNQYIPKSLTALRLWVDYFDGRAPISNSLNTLLTGLTQLAFLWLDDYIRDPLAEPLTLAQSASSLQLLCHRDSFYEVLRTDAGVTLEPPWSFTKAVFPSVDDLGCADRYWLMEGHWEVIHEQLRRRGDTGGED